MTLVCNSSHGEFEIDGDSGEVLSCTVYDPDTHDDEPGVNFRSITRFDVDEWRRTYGRPLPDEVDILDVGFWYHDDPKHGEGYEPPVHSWRRERA